MKRPKTITLIVRMELKSMPDGEIYPAQIIVTAPRRPSDQTINALAVDMAEGMDIAKFEVEETWEEI